MNSMNTMAKMINNGGKNVILTITGVGSYSTTTYNSYNILAATSGSITISASKKIKIGYLIVGGGGNVNSLQYGGAGGQVIINNLSYSTTYLEGNTAYTLNVGVGGTYSSISGPYVGITANAGSTAATSSIINGTTVLAGRGGFNNGRPSYTGGIIDGSPGINLATYPLTDINLNSQYLGGGGAAHSGSTAGFGGRGGGGGNGVDGNSGDTAYFLTTYATGATFGGPGQAGLGSGGDGGLNTGGGGGGYFSTGGSGVILIYY